MKTHKPEVVACISILMLVASVGLAAGQGMPQGAAGSQKANTPSAVLVAPRRVLAGQRPSVVGRLQPVRRLAAAQPLDLVLGLPLRNREALTRLLQDLYNPASPGYRHYLTPAQFAEQFGPTEEDYQLLSAFVSARGFQVTGTHPNRTLLDIRGSVADVERMFQVEMEVYPHPTESRTFFAPDREPTTDLPIPLAGMDGLQDFVLPKPVDLRLSLPADDSTGVPGSTGSGPNGRFLGSDFRAAYASGVTLDGSGQAVGLFELDGYFPGDILAYENLAGLPNVTLTDVALNPGSGTPRGNNAEVALDIEMTIAMAPGLSKVLVYEGYFANDVFNRMATDNQARQLSSSWGFAAQVDPVRDQIFQQFAAQGQTLFQASGDNGAWNATVFAPADNPLVTSVGGTSLTTSNSGGAWLSETVWPGSGGGISPNYAIPNWQRGLDFTANQGSSTMRNGPDVASMADGSIWVVIYNGQQGSIAGTSAAAPQWAGFAALVNQQAAANGQAPVGFLNPALYALGASTNYAACFHDITSGNNTNAGSANKFVATPGYDLCTGWGSPAGGGLIQALLPPADALSVTPASALAAIGPTNGPFLPSSQVFLLTNTGAASLNWTLANTSSWLTVTPTGGTLSPGRPAVPVTVSSNAAAGDLSAGNHLATLTFSNLNNGFALTRQFVLTTVNPPEPGARASLLALHSFAGGDGRSPNGLVQGGDGAFYGTTAHGGSGDQGTVFRMPRSGNLSTLYSFTAGLDGAVPLARLAAGWDGSWYGSSMRGGSNSGGTIFQVTTNGALTTLVSFNRANGLLPYAGLAAGTDVQFYGVAYEGGDASYGEIFRLSAAGNLTSLYAFTNGSDGSLPYAALARGADGAYYGTTLGGGLYTDGTVFRITTSGAFSTLVAFNGTNGAYPYSELALGDDGAFYGTASAGGAGSNGTLFRITSSGGFSNLYSFTGGSDGGRPVAGLLPARDGNFYGVTSTGGANGFGTVFRLAPGGVVTTLAAFNGLDGAHPQTTLLQGVDGQIYGSAPGGGVSGLGTVYQLVVSRAPEVTCQPSSQTVFAGTNLNLMVSVFGTEPMTYQWSKDGTNLAGVGNWSGAGGRILQITNISATNAGNYSVVISNRFGIAASASALLQVTSSPLVLVTQPGNQTVSPGATALFSATAAGDQPLSYRWRSNGTSLNDGTNVAGASTATLTLSHVTEANNATYSLLVSNTLDAITSAGAVLTVIPVSAVGTRLTTLHWFGARGQGSSPNGLIQGADGNLYGTTAQGGSNGYGTIFKLGGDGALAVLHHFAPDAEGGGPLAALAPGAGGTFFGTAASGGAKNEGTLFRATSTGDLTPLYAFSGAEDGGGPTAALLPGRDGRFYGTTPAGGGFNQGNVFSITPDGAFTNIYSFTGGSDGSSPQGALVQASDGNLYGTTLAGALGYGNVFELSPGGVLTNLHSFTGGTDGSSPAGALIQASDGSLYGVTKHNSMYGYQLNGTAFKITTNGLMTTLVAFNYMDGSYPSAGLIEGRDGNFYGTTWVGGANGVGTLFRMTPAGSLSTLISFDSFNDGANPQSELVQAADDSLYGANPVGGPGRFGTIFRLVMTGAPQITQQPAGVTVVAGANGSLSLAVFGAPTLSYQWMKNGTNLANGGNRFGADTRMLRLAPACAADAGNYSVRVANGLGAVTSSVVTLTVIAPPMFQNYALTNGVLALTWTAAAGQKYQLQANADLGPNSWTNVGGLLTATGALLTATDAPGSVTQRYYRVILFPQPAP